MGKTWILDTETKGTGAHMVPLEKALQKPSPRQALDLVEFDRPPRVLEPTEPLAPLTFKVVDVRSSRVLADGTETRETVELLEGIGSVVDVRIYVWMRLAERWRLLTLAEQKTLWNHRGQGGRSPESRERVPAA
jgi:hypothetical protein